jgi:hypothetical protein
MDNTGFFNLVQYINPNSMDNLIYTVMYILKKTKLIEVQEILNIYNNLNICTILRHRKCESIYDYKIYFPKHILEELLKIRMRTFIIHCLEYLNAYVPFDINMVVYSNYLEHHFKTKKENEILNSETIIDCNFLKNQEVGDVDPLTIWENGEF